VTLSCGVGAGATSPGWQHGSYDQDGYCHIKLGPHTVLTEKKKINNSEMKMVHSKPTKNL
jgi:hypothetical protein